MNGENTVKGWLTLLFNAIDEDDRRVGISAQERGEIFALVQSEKETFGKAEYERGLKEGTEEAEMRIAKRLIVAMGLPSGLIRSDEDLR